jgi:hypothetical protein
MIECYLSECPFHESNKEHGIEGPFCGQEFCMLNDRAIKKLYEHKKLKKESND